LQLFQQAGLPNLVSKSRDLTAFLDWLIDKRAGKRIGTITPAAERGAQLSLVVRDPAINGRALFDQLGLLNVTGDWREPRVIRVAPAPLYNSYVDAFDFVERLEIALQHS
jgi:kynureninase